MGQSQGKGWSNCLYSESNAQMWQNAFEKQYWRACEAFIEVTGKTQRDVVMMAMRSQIGWELYKSLIKEIKKVDEIYSEQTKTLFRKVWFFDIEHTIQMFSRNVAIALANIKNEYKNEFDYLTKWWSEII